MMFGAIFIFIQQKIVVFYLCAVLHLIEFHIVISFAAFS